MRRLFEPIDNAGLVVFRMLFGFLLFAETLGAILTGWVYRNLIEPEYTFPHIGFDWLQLPGWAVYAHFIAMSVLGLMVMAGYRYRLALGSFTILWTAAYLMQKVSYNNHYYLLLLVCIIMWWLPANRYASWDAKRNPTTKSTTMPRWCAVVMVLQIAIVYLFAVVSKLYPAWLDGSYIDLMLSAPNRTVFVKGVFDQHWFHLFLAWSGLAFDLLIVPALLWRRTRTIAFVAALVFHLFNAIVLQIGIFPFFALAFVLFFYPPENIRRWFLREKIRPETNCTLSSDLSAIYFFIPFFVLQLALPVRHYFIEGDVLWTEEGHRLSWRMMLRQKQAYSHYKVVDRKTGAIVPYRLEDHLTPKQIGFVSFKPDGIWQMAQYIKEHFARQNKDVAVYVTAMVSVNGGPFLPFVDSSVDLAHADWNYFGHSSWLLPEGQR
ncbi:Vitamin K-dependent gamma-carboxylase [Flavobacterium caeni]|uniref:Vitamin K-dependent gamma-carboxylase n=2 Tax=Flavobacterium caeni TaxID=490189 RepID=A0A1G5ED43_9FLAO|nr:Vitamin K-dependent gamma-carboxylase [Flavobacterium caeni]